MNDNNDDTEWMLGEVQLYIHMKSTTWVMLSVSTLKMLECVVRVTIKAWTRMWSRMWSRINARTWMYARVSMI